MLDVHRTNRQQRPLSAVRQRRALKHKASAIDAFNQYHPGMSHKMTVEEKESLAWYLLVDAVTDYSVEKAIKQKKGRQKASFQTFLYLFIKLRGRAFYYQFKEDRRARQLITQDDPDEKSCPILADPKTHTPDFIAERKDFVEHVHKALNKLPFLYRDVLERRYGLRGSPIYSLKEISAIHHRSKQSIQQIQTRALDKLTFYLNCQGVNKGKAVSLDA